MASKPAAERRYFVIAHWGSTIRRLCFVVLVDIVVVVSVVLSCTAASVVNGQVDSKREISPEDCRSWHSVSVHIKKAAGLTGTASKVALGIEVGVSCAGMRGECNDDNN